MLPGVAYWDTGELQAVAPLLGTAHPTGFPTYVLHRLAGVGRPPAVRRAGLPDEPAVRPVPRGGGRLHGRPRARTDRSAGDRDRGRHRAGPDPDRLGDRDPRRGAHPPPGARGGPALAPGRVGREGPLTRRRPTRPGRPLPACRDGGLRAGRRQPFADPAAGDPGRAVRARRRPGDLATRPARPVVHRPARGDRRPRLPRAAPARRAVPGGPRVRHAEHVGRLPLHRPRRAVPGQPVQPVRRAATQVRRAHQPHGVAVRDPGPAHPGRVRRDRDPPAPLCAADRDGRGDHLLLRRLVRQRRHQPATTSVRR